MSREKVSRKKLLHEPDEFHTVTQRIWLWVHENRRLATLIAGGIGAAVLIGVGGKALVESSRERRDADVAQAVGRYAKAAGTAIPADLQHDLAALAVRHAGSPQGAVARYFHAGALAAAGEGDKARPLYEQMSKSQDKDDTLAGLSGVALAYLDLARGANDAALPAFQELLKVQDAAVARAQIMIEIAAIHERQGRPADARRVYQELLAEHPDGSWTAVAKQRLLALPEETPAS